MRWLSKRDSGQLSEERQGSGADGVPRHVAIIMDGNGRWAKRRLLPRQAGHRAGAENLKRITRAASEAGIRYLTVFAFSTENWQRPSEEVDTLMALFIEFISCYDEELEKNDVRLRFMGNAAVLSADVQAAMALAERKSARRGGMQLILAFNYGGRDELLRAMSRWLFDCQEAASREASTQELTPQEDSAQGLPKQKFPPLDEKSLRRYLDLPDVPDPDLVIRTSGEMRISNFMLWQVAYSEFYVTDVLWPDFSAQTLDAALAAYAGRKRRFGGIE